MIPGFKLRLLQEIRALINTRIEFEALKVHRDLVAIPDCVYAPNIC